MPRSSCSVLELADFDFESNDCSDYCGVLLPKQSRLQDVRVRRVRFSGSANRSTAVFYASSGSRTSVEYMNAVENECSLLHIKGGSLNLSNVSFTQNPLNSSATKTANPCIRLSNASALIRESRFEGNKARIGSAIVTSTSNVTLMNTSFERNAATQGGIMVLRDSSSALIQSCNFSYNIADESGGVLLASNSRVIVEDSTLKENRANQLGGCFCLKFRSELEMRQSTLKRNEANFGGIVHLAKRSMANLSESSFSVRHFRSAASKTLLNDGARTHESERCSPQVLSPEVLTPPPTRCARRWRRPRTRSGTGATCASPLRYSKP